MKYRYLSDCHTHSDCSPDASDPTMMLCECACRLGLYALTITDHCECNVYREEEYDRSVRQSYFEARKASAVFHGRLHVRAGIELGQPMQNIEAAEDILDACDFDFTLASVHNVQGMPDFYELDYSQVDLTKTLHQYFDEILETIEWGKFDSLAHLTYPWRYIVGEHGLAIDDVQLSGRIDEVLTALIKNGKALEVNTSGLRQKLGETMPNLQIVKRYYELGGKLVTLGSDAHRWPDVGAGMEEGMKLIRQAGFTHFALYSHHSRSSFQSNEYISGGPSQFWEGPLLINMVSIPFVGFITMKTIYNAIPIYGLFLDWIFSLVGNCCIL